MLPFRTRAQRDALRPPVRGFRLEEDQPAGAGEAFGASFGVTTFTSQTVSRERNMSRHLRPAMQAIFDTTGDERFRPFDHGALPRDVGEMERVYRESQDFVEQARKAHPEAGLKTFSEVQDEIEAELVRRQEQAADIGRRSQGLATAAGVAGAFAGVAVDPLNLATLHLGAARGTTLLMKALLEAGINAAVEVGTTPLVWRYHRELGQEFTLGQAVGNVAVSAGAGFALTGMLGLAGRAWGKTYRRLVSEGKVAPTPKLDAIAEVVEKYDELRSSSPDGPEGVEPFLKAYGRAEADVLEGRVPEVDLRTARAAPEEMRPPPARPTEEQVRIAAMTREQFVTERPRPKGPATRATLERLSGDLPERGPEGLAIETPTRGDQPVTDVIAVVRRDEEGKVVGVLKVLPDDSGRPSFVQLAVGAAHQRQGVGRELIEAARARVPEIDALLTRGGLTESGAALVHSRATEAVRSFEAFEARKAGRAGPQTGPETPAETDPFTRPAAGDYDDLDEFFDQLGGGQRAAGAEAAAEAPRAADTTPIDEDFAQIEATRPEDLLVAEGHDAAGNPTALRPAREVIEEAEAEAGYWRRWLDCMGGK